MQDLIFRFGEQSDIPQMDIVQSESIAGLCRSHYTDREIEALVLNLKPDCLSISQGIFSGFFVYIAEIDRRIVGFCSLDGKGIINDLYVLPKYSRSGIGSQLLTSVESIAKQKGIELIRVTASLNARDFHAQLGYRYLYDTARSIVSGVVIKAIEMEKLIS